MLRRFIHTANQIGVTRVRKVEHLVDSVQSVERVLNLIEPTTLLQDGHDKCSQVKKVDWKHMNTVEPATPARPGTKLYVLRVFAAIDRITNAGSSSTSSVIGGCILFNLRGSAASTE